MTGIQNENAVNYEKSPHRTEISDRGKRRGVGTVVPDGGHALRAGTALVSGAGVVTGPAVFLVLAQVDAASAATGFAGLAIRDHLALAGEARLATLARRTALSAIVRIITEIDGGVAALSLTRRTGSGIRRNLSSRAMGWKH